MRPVEISNAKVLTPYRLIESGSVVFSDSQIKFVGKRKGKISSTSSKVLDAQGLYVAPGFVDIHVHGGGGGDTMDADIKSIKAITATHATGGTTSLLLTTLTAPFPQIVGAIKAAEAAMQMKTYNGARILGVHLEGPYFNPSYAGAQNPEFLRNPRKEDYLPILDRYRSIKRVSLAPELPGAIELICELKKRGIMASIGHSGASYQDALAAIEAGCSHVTHMFSGMSGIKRVSGYRITGLIEATLLLDELTTELIADGHHIPPSLLKLVVKAKRWQRIALVTDAMAATGLGPGHYNLGGIKTVVEHDVPENFERVPPPNSYVAKLNDRSAFAGSVAKMNQLIRNMVQLADVPLLEAIKMATLNPARFLGVGGVGVLYPGAMADIVIFDDRFTIMLTIVGGKIVYQHKEFAIPQSFWEGQ